MNLKSCAFIINRCLVIGQNPVTRNVCIVALRTFEFEV